MNENLVTLLHEVSVNFQLRLSQMEAIHDLQLAPFQARLLSVIGRMPGVSQLDLAVSTERDKSQVARAIKELERRGLVRREAHASDWRTQCVYVTDEGDRAAHHIDRQRKQVVSMALRECSAEEKAVFCLILDKINRALL